MNLHIKIPKQTANLLSLLLLAFSLLSGLAWSAFQALAEPDAPAVGNTGIRKYYLTVGSFDGGTADENACATGYHMASLWEIQDTSNLEYDTFYGILSADGGAGPNSAYEGWVRTGYHSSVSITPGEGNCAAWTSFFSNDYGTTAKLDQPWAPSIGRWYFNTRNCSTNWSVWCVED